MRHEELYLADLVDNARVVGQYLEGVTRELWDSDRKLRDAVLYRMLLLGEIASSLPEELRERHPEVAWRAVRGFRNLSVHRYFGVDWSVVWTLGREEVPVLADQAMAILRAEYPDRAKLFESAAEQADGDAGVSEAGSSPEGPENQAESD